MSDSTEPAADREDEILAGVLRKFLRHGDAYTRIVGVAAYPELLISGRLRLSPREVVTVKAVIRWDA